MTQSNVSGRVTVMPSGNDGMPFTSNPFVESLFSNLPVAVYTCDCEGFIEYYNSAAVELWGQEPVIGTTRWSGAWKVFLPDGSSLAPGETPMARMLKGGSPLKNEEFVIQRPNGSVRTISANPSLVYDAEGKLIGGNNILVDITEMKTSEEKQATLAAIVESSDDAIISKRLDGTITSWNKAAERLFGYAESEAIGKHISVLIPPERLEEEQVIIEKVSNNEKVDHFETIRMTKTGQRIPISLTVSPVLNAKGNIIGASKIVRDISRQKMSDDRLSRYIKSLEVLNAVGKAISEDLDIEVILQKVTDATTQLTGAAFGAFFHNVVNHLGESYMLFTLSGATKEAFEKFGMPRNTDVFHPTFAGEYIVRVDDITKDPRYGRNPPHNGQPEGHLPVVSYMAVPVISKSGAVIGGLFFGHPEAARFTQEHEQLVSAIAVQAAVALDNAKLYEEIKVLNAKKDEFIGLASHELKTPVTSISGYLQIIEQAFKKENRDNAFVTKARAQLNKLTALVADLLDVSKIQTGKLPLSNTSFDLHHLLQEVTEVMQLNHSQYEVVLDCKPGKIMMVADHQRIEQVLINLISNAIKYSPKANRVIVRATASKDKVKVSVQDFGIGIEQEQHDRIFSRFYRVENLASHMSGLGIGLYISQEIIKRHGGELTVQSTVGKGSTFLFEIPLVRGRI